MSFLELGLTVETKAKPNSRKDTVLSRWFNYAVSCRCDPKGLHINKRIK